MEVPLIVIFVVAFISAIFSIASTAIGVRALDNNPEYKDKHKSDHGFLVFNLVLAVLVLVGSGMSIAYHLKSSYGK
jgi:hypothetical protein